MTTINHDPILVSVISNRLDSITKEMGKTMLRTSRSPIFSEARDFVTAIFDRKLRLIAQTAYIPVLVGASPWASQSIAETFKNNINDGDVFILNDPYRGNNHPPDVTIARPVFWENEIAFWTLTKGHQADIGGGGAAGYHPEARSVWDEGVRIPPVKLYEQGQANQGVWQLILSNVRLTFLVEGDIQCLVGATRVGERNLKALLEKYQLPVLDSTIDELLDASEKLMRDEISRIPDGIYKSERQIDNDGIALDQPVNIRVKVEVKGDQISFDFSESDAQVQGYVNSPYPNTASAAQLSVYTMVDSNIRQNEGAMRPVNCLAPSGNVLNPQDPAPSTACTVLTVEAIMEAVWLALSDVIPQRVQSCWARWFAPATAGFNPRTGRPFGEIHFMSKGGGGASEGYDGWDHMGTVICLGGLRSPDLELHEMVNPYFIEEFEYLPDSAGAGKWRGGHGVIYRWRIDADDIMCANFGSGTQSSTAPYGLCGGKSASRNTMYLYRQGGNEEEITANTLMPLMKDQRIEIRSGGGGGFGDPKSREVEKVLADIKDGLVSPEKAKVDYGVSVNSATLELNKAETEQLRKSG